jgi:hypothetical protein
LGTYGLKFAAFGTALAGAGFTVTLFDLVMISGALVGVAVLATGLAVDFLTGVTGFLDTATLAGDLTTDLAAGFFAGATLTGVLVLVLVAAGFFAVILAGALVGFLATGFTATLVALTAWEGALTVFFAAAFAAGFFDFNVAMVSFGNDGKERL